MDRSAFWYAIMTRPCGEEEAENRLKETGFATFYPHFPSYHEWRGRDDRHSRLVKVPKRPLLPSYMFADTRLDGQLRFDLIHDVPWVSCIVGPPGQDPRPIPSKFMTRLEAMTDPAGAVLPASNGDVYKSGKIKPRFQGKIGDMVRLGVGMGAWAGFVEAVRDIDMDGQIIVDLEMFNRPMQMTVPVEECELLSKPQAGR